jgi:cell division protein ZapA (FtsZ GTPase activity inhibitor)
VNAVKLLGREYKLRGEPDEAHLDEVVEYLNEVLRKVQDGTPDTQDAAILAALNVASDLIRLRHVTPQADRIQALIDLVDSA